MQKIVRTTTRGAVVLVVMLALFSGAIAAGATQTYLGDTVKLSGYSYAGDTVYLFLTGPNLPVNGVALDNINRLADQGGATPVDVDADGHWSYDWYTGAVGGRLDAGAYTVWVADRRTDRSHLSTADYTTITIGLSVPSLTARTSDGSGTSEPSQPGSIEFNAVPDGTSVVVNNTYKGMTPLTVSNLSPGTYNITLSHFRYAALSVPVIVRAGSVSEVNATLVALTGSLFVNTTPAGAQLTLDGITSGMSPATLPDIIQGSHLLNVSKEGFVTQSIPVQISTNQTTTVDIVLLPSGGFGMPGFLPITAAAALLVALLVARRWLRK
jgi:PEGA domain